MASEVATHPSYRMMGTRVQALTMDDLHAVIGATIDARRQAVVAHQNQHGLYLVQRDAQMRAFYEQAEYVHVDGMAVVLLGRLLGLPLERRHRTTYVDWIGPLMREAEERGWRVFFLGGRPGIGERASTILRERHPGLVIASAHGYFDQRHGSAESRERIERILAFAPDLLLVGLGMPRQERWIAAHRSELPACAILTSGACMDYVAGEVPTPPRWMGRTGLEWLARLISEPRRLWKRYLLEPWLLLAVFAREWLRLRVARRRG